jgi:TonB family protein
MSLGLFHPMPSVVFMKLPAVLLCLTTQLAVAQSQPDSLLDCAALRSRTGTPQYVDEVPTCRAGGSAGLVKHIGATLNPQLRRAGAGKVFIGFVVTAAGQVRCPEVVRGLGAPFDAEAVRVVRQFGPFVPATKDGRAVPCWLTVPVTFGR